MLGKNLVTHQTGPEGRQVRRVLIEQGLNIERELYLAMVLDRAQSRVTVICSSEGGVEIEEVAAKHPEKIFERNDRSSDRPGGLSMPRLGLRVGRSRQH